ncbi:MAG: hypothetical protein ACHQYQ_03220 [Bacteriovoracales bacterium]
MIFYGGRKTSLDLGHMISVEIARSRSTETIYKASEWNIIWAADLLRSDFSAVSLMCLYFEIISKLSLEESLHDEDDIQQSGLFSVLSNGVYYIEQTVKNKTFVKEQQLLLFLGKLVLEQGISPRMKTCVFCDQILEKSRAVNLLFEKGGFSCEFCYGGTKGEEGKGLWSFLQGIRTESHRDFSFERLNFQNVRSLGQLLFDYFCFQFQLEPKSFKTLPMVF